MLTEVLRLMVVLTEVETEVLADVEVDPVKEVADLTEIVEIVVAVAVHQVHQALQAHHQVEEAQP